MTQVKFMEVKTTIFEINTVVAVNSRLDTATEKVNELDGTARETTQNETQSGQRLKKERA